MLWPKPNCLIIDPADGLTDANRWAESSGKMTFCKTWRHVA